MTRFLSGPGSCGSHLVVRLERGQDATLPRGERLGHPDVEHVGFGDRRRVGVRLGLDPLQVGLQVHPERMGRLHEIFRRFDLDLVDLSHLRPRRFEDAARLGEITELLPPGLTDRTYFSQQFPHLLRHVRTNGGEQDRLDLHETNDQVRVHPVQAQLSVFVPDRL
jgi:hypothetical protein